MSYSKDLERFVLELKGGVFFLSPRERTFLELLEDMGIPEEIVREGVENCYRALNPRRRSKYPLFLCFRSIMESYENYQKLRVQRLDIDWKRRFYEKIKLVQDLIKEVEEPSSEEEAQRILKEAEREILKKLWKKLSREERERIKKKYEGFRENKELFGELVKGELKRMFGIPDLSLYVD